MSRTDDLILEVKSSLRKYDEAGLLDEISMRRDIIKALKRFGNSIGTLTEAVVKVENGRGDLPRNFLGLQLAALCEPLAYYVDGDHDALQSSYFYKERIENVSTWSDCEACCKTSSEKVVRENLYFSGGTAHFVYANPTLLKLGKSFNKSKLATNCRNKVVRDGINEISIVDDDTLQTNFKEGYVYMRFYGLPLDEDGEIDIPSTFNGELESYLEYYLLRRCTEKLMSNADAMQGLQSLYSVYMTQEVQLRGVAARELKMKSITPSAMSKIQAMNRLDMLKYEIVTPWH